jgi:hypothetical protein
MTQLTKDSRESTEYENVSDKNIQHTTLNTPHIENMEVDNIRTT